MTEDALPVGAGLLVVPATVHGRTLMVPPVAGGARWLVGFHGYAQSADDMLESMRGVPGAGGWRLVAVQALHPFYNRADHVVANWMTRQDRAHAIADNVAYVDAVFAAIAAQSGAPDAIVCTGFSQGVAMAYRAALLCAPAAAAIVAVAGDVPPEFHEHTPRPWPRVRMLTGTSDAWYTPARMTADADRLRARGADVRATAFDGGHAWTPAVAGAVGDVLCEVANP